MTTAAHPPEPAHLLADQLSALTLPSDYIRPFSFPLPKHKFVGVLACQRDPLLKELVTKVVKCEKRTSPPPATGKGSGKGGKGKKAPAAEGEKKEEEVEMWEIELEDTVLFPEGGGQPSDAGSLTPLDSAGNAQGEPIPVLKVLRHGLSAIHYCTSPLPVNSPVLARVDWARRWDHSTQHTGQHILSGILDTLSLPTLSWSLTPSPQPCYIELPRAPTPQELQYVQEKANEYIREGRRVHVTLSLSSELAERPESLPEDYVGGVIRDVDIVGVDRGPCCGTHLPSLAPLQQIYIYPYTTSVRGTNARVYFVVGPRVLEALGPAADSLRKVGLELGCGAGEVGVKVGELVGKEREARRREGKVRDELAGYVARDLWARAEMVGGEEGGVKVGVLMRLEEDAQSPLEFLNTITYRLRELLQPEGRQQKPHLFALASSGAGGSPLVIIGSPDLAVNKAGELVKERMGVRGGGKGRWQGKKEGKWKAGDEGVLLEILKEAAMAAGA